MVSLGRAEVEQLHVDSNNENSQHLYISIPYSPVPIQAMCTHAARQIVADTHSQ